MGFPAQLVRSFEQTAKHSREKSVDYYKHEKVSCLLNKQTQKFVKFVLKVYLAWIFVVISSRELLCCTYEDIRDFEVSYCRDCCDSRRTHKKFHHATAKFQGHNYKQEDYFLSMSIAVLFYYKQVIILVYCNGGSRQWYRFLQAPVNPSQCVNPSAMRHIMTYSKL